MSDGDREAGRKKLDAFRAAKAAKAAEVKSGERGHMGTQAERSAEHAPPSSAAVSDEAATMRQKLLKAVKKGKSIEAERDALVKRVEEINRVRFVTPKHLKY